MPLINCPECNKEYSSERLSNRLYKRNIICWNCGYDLGRWADRMDWEKEKKLKEFQKRIAQ